jgi:hypothetical protein
MICLQNKSIYLNRIVILNFSNYYEIPYNLRGNQSGVYIIIVTASNERKQSKLIFK